ncbi:hypothetical protein KKIDH5335_48740 (plasmid) [Vibrio fluvialis]|nr:hypothetical protein KKIDH5335_48740 [Vibrio fluvialis]
MFDIFKFLLLAAGCVALYGLATGADLNELFKETIEKVTPAIEAIIQGIKTFLINALKNN